ncbi:MAG: ParB/RepB/Spo0J family partition protein [Oscillospiraceae bacterium]|nr:ParB/RepB/Spo0J family partition protein [Oscillospiraceae bacterium]
MTKTKPWMETGRVVFLPIRKICPNPAQPRKVFEEEGLQELAASILQYGILQPLTVRRQEDGYELVAGERRLRAARMAGLSDVPCIVMAMDEEQSGMLALVENLQRRDLDFIEEAEGLAKLMRLYGLSQEQAAVRVGKSQSAVANKLRLLRHSPAVLAALRQHSLSERHARALLKLPSEQQRLDAIRVIAERKLNVAATEQYIDRLTEKKEAPPRGLRGFVLRDVRVFLNTVSHNLDIIRSAGINAACGQEETEHEIVLTIRIPKQAG